MILFHTVENRDNPDHIENNAPFLCNRQNAWLGKGYYFWDTFLKNAHWWGETNYEDNGYVIVKFTCEKNEKLLDLYGDLEIIEKFRNIIYEFQVQNLINENTTLPMVIEYLKKKTEFLNHYEGIRIYGHYSKSKDQIEKILFADKHKIQYFDLSPAVQVCLFKKTSLNLSKGTIIYPIEFVNEVYM